MVNVNAPRGFAPLVEGFDTVRYVEGLCTIAANNTDAFYLQQAVGGTSSAVVKLAAVTTSCLGVIAFIIDDADGRAVVYAPATKANTYSVYLYSPDMKFIAMADGAITLAQTAGATAITGSTTSGMSTSVLVSATAHATANTFKVERLLKTVETNTAAAYALYIISVNLKA